MRQIDIAFAIVISTFMTTELKAQYPQAQVQVMPQTYRYASPPRPVFVRNYHVAPRYVRQPNPTGYRNRPYYGAYGYGNYSNGSTDGFPPFQGRRSR